MPIYEYYCSLCRNRFERMRPMSDADATAACPDCASPAGRVLSMFAAHAGGRTESAGATATATAPSLGGFGGGCCGGACGCH